MDTNVTAAFQQHLAKRRANIYSMFKNPQDALGDEVVKAETDDIEKAVYADNALNRKLGRVGQEYGGKGSRGGKTDNENGKSKTNKLWKPPYELDENAVSEFLTEREDVDYIDALIMNNKESISKLRKLAFDRAKKKGVSLKAAWAGVKDKKERERIKDFEEYGHSMSEPKHWKEESKNNINIKAED